MATEAWLRGSLEGFDALLMPAAHALVQASEDITGAAQDLSVAELWTKPCGASSVAFHLRHIAGSIDRLLTYARDEELTAEQFATLEAEATFDADPPAASALLNDASARIEEALQFLRAMPIDTLFELRTVGRAHLPTSVFGLLFHIAEHAQRHTGQVVTTAGIVRRLSRMGERGK